MNLVTRLRALMVLVFAVLALPPALAMAQNTAWRPAFNSNTHVYIDPALSGDPDFPVALPGLADKLRDAGVRNNVKFYVVAVKQANERGGNPSITRIDELILQWQNSLPSNYLLVLWMRSSTNPSEGWVAVNAGSDLKVYGLSKGTLESASGPVVPAVTKYMPQDPRGAFLAIADGVNKVIDEYNAEQERQRAHDEFMGWVPWIVVVVLVLGGVGVFVFFRKQAGARVRTNSGALLKNWGTQLESANGFYLKLRNGYLGFVKDQANWKDNFVEGGKTRKDYLAALKNFADFSARLKKANERLKHAQTLAETGNHAGVVETLTNETITVTGKDIPIEEATLFGGLVETTNYKPSDLLGSMEALFNQTNQGLAGIKKALEEAIAAGEQLDSLQGDMEYAKLRLGDPRFASFAAQIETLDRDEEQVRATFKTDPVSAKDAMLALVARARTLKGSLPK